MSEIINEKKQFQSKRALKGYKRETLGLVNAHRQMSAGKKFKTKAPTSKQRRDSDKHALKSAIQSARAMGLNKPKPKAKVAAKPVTKGFRDRLRSRLTDRKAVRGSSNPAAQASPAALSTPAKAPPKPQTGFDPGTAKIKQEMSADAKRVEWVRRQILNPNKPRPRPEGMENHVHVDEYMNHASYNAGKENWIGLHNALPMIKAQHHQDLAAGASKKGLGKRRHTRRINAAYKSRISRAHEIESFHNPEHVRPGILSRLKRAILGEDTSSAASLVKELVVEAQRTKKKGNARPSGRGRGEALKAAKHRTPGALVNRTKGQVEKGLEKSNRSKRETARANEAHAKRTEDEREARAKNKQYQVT